MQMCEYDPEDDPPARVLRGCQCFGPGECAGTCPGPASCPMCQEADDEGDE